MTVKRVLEIVLCDCMSILHTFKLSKAIILYMLVDKPYDLDSPYFISVNSLIFMTIHTTLENNILLPLYQASGWIILSRIIHPNLAKECMAPCCWPTIQNP